ncbi:hypothetical protein SAMN06295879_2767 [Agreia bicolorata]|uniref:Uncharacterized protein n=1 Tax=Agreia bicolorata TaxID=110935 RepID=A0A1T4YBW1_9MICO|nr:hypothetical protein [Agreia bicolorata]SKA99327.1 hypothetical protein SAMN06295879_2767 [Agreia bicolorata]
MNDDDAATDAQRRELQRRVFSAASDAADARVAARQLQQLDARRMHEALDRHRRPLTAPEPAPPHEDSAPPSQNRSDSDPLSESILPHTTGRASSRLSVARLAVAALLSLAVGVAIGLSVAERPDAVPEPTASRAVVDTRGALALFDRPQVAADRPVESLPPTVITESIRALGDPFFKLYIGRNAADMVCILAAQPEDSFAMSCVPVDEFPSTGLRLEWSGEMNSMSADGARGTVRSTMRAVWMADGALDFSGSPR